MTVRQFDPKKITLQFAGIVLEGYADGSFVDVEQTTESFSSYSGTDGSVSRSKSSDKRAMVTVKLAHTSPSNVLLGALHQRDIDLPNGAGVGQFLMEDREGSLLIRGDEAWIVSRPKVERDRVVKEQEWKIEIAEAEWTF